MKTDIMIGLIFHKISRTSLIAIIGKHLINIKARFHRGNMWYATLSHRDTNIKQKIQILFDSIIRKSWYKALTWRVIFEIDTSMSPRWKPQLTYMLKARQVACYMLPCVAPVESRPYTLHWILNKQGTPRTKEHGLLKEMTRYFVYV